MTPAELKGKRLIVSSLARLWNSWNIHTLMAKCDLLQENCTQNLKLSTGTEYETQFHSEPQDHIKGIHVYLKGQAQECSEQHSTMLQLKTANSECPPKGEWINKCSIFIHRSNKNKQLHAATWMTLRNLM